jgi:hypothetical protein
MGAATFEASGEAVVMILRARTNGVASSRSGRNCVTTQLRAPRELRGDAEKMKASCPSTYYRAASSESGHNHMRMWLFVCRRSRANHHRTRRKGLAPRSYASGFRERIA